MIWSKLKKAVETLMADAVKAHLQVHLTHYGSGKTYIMNRAWVTWDGKEVSTFSTIQWCNARESLAARISGDGEQRFHYECYEQAEKLLEQQGLYPCESFLAALENYVSLSIEDALHSPNALIRAWAMFDRRLGKRRLRALHLAQDDSQYQHLWYQLRCEAEKLS
ncbi:MAG TPA: hypothetical protein VKY19_19655 [Ktedonosporobacter sp.]|jgi:hypothetical protein|nr:hypothetical protein [Ktedonosporobacter sp.]